MNRLEINRIRQTVKAYLDQSRYEHTLGVMYTAGALAMRYEANIENAMVAGLLHDCAKCLSSREKIEFCEKYDLDVSEAEQNNPGLLHAKIGAYLAIEKYHMKDLEIVDAIAYHTTGRPNMTLMDKIIYIADYIEPYRSEAPNLKEIRRLAFVDIDECLYVILQDSLDYLKRNKGTIDPRTEQTYLYYKERR